MNRFFFLFLFIMVISCGQSRSQQAKTQEGTSQPHQIAKTEKGYKTAFFSSGCFWCSESIYESVIGVIKVTSGYSGGTGKNPTYQNYIQKGHAETVKVIYDPKVIDFNSLLTVYFGSQNVTQQNGQGSDRGSGYRSIIFYQNAKEKREITEEMEEIQKQYNQPIAAEVKPFKKFWKAEDYHQDYEKNHPNQPYIRNVSIPRIDLFKNKYPELIKKKD